MQLEGLPRLFRPSLPSSLAVLLFLSAMGIQAGLIARDSYFLKTAGAEKIPLLYILAGVLMLPLAALYSHLVERRHPGRLQIQFQLGGGVIVLLLWAWISRPGNPPAFLPYLTFCLVELLFRFLIIHFWTLANHLIDAAPSRRLFPYIGGVGLLGTVTGAASASLIAPRLGGASLMAVWASLILLAIPLALRLAQRRPAEEKAINPSSLKADDESGSWKRLWREPLIRTMTYMALPLWMMIFIIEYNYFGVMQRVFPDQHQLAASLGAVAAIASLTGITLQFSVTPWLINHYGVAATLMAYPLSLTAGAIALLCFSLFPSAALPGQPLQLWGIALLAIFARLCDVAIYYSVYESTEQLLHYAVPEPLRRKSRVFLSAMILPTSAAAAGAFLIAFRQIEEPVYSVSCIGVLLGFLLIALGLNLTPDYLKSLLARIRPQDERSRQEILLEMSRLESSDARYALLDSLASENLQEATFAAEQLMQAPDEDLFADIEEVLSQIQPKVLVVIESLLSNRDRESQAGFVKRLRSKIEAQEMEKLNA